MKVLYLTNLASPYRVDFFNELGKYCDLTVIFEREVAANREKVWLSKKAVNFKAIFLKGLKIKHDTALCLSVLKFLKKSQYHIFIIGGYSTPTGMFAIIALRLKRIPFFINSDGGFIKEDSRIKRYIKRFFISKASWWLSTGGGTNKYLEHYGANIKNVYTYPFTSLFESDICITPADIKEKAALRNELRIQGERVVLGVGQFIHRKGFDIAIKAFENISKDVTLILVGGGLDKEKYENLIKDIGLDNAQVISFKNSKTLKKYYRAADIFLMPTREDIWGLVINEAMAAGLPILSTDAALSAQELVLNEENGWLVESENIDILSDKLNAMLDSEDKLIMMGKKSIGIIQEYTFENMAKAHINIFNRIMEKISKETSVKRTVKK